MSEKKPNTREIQMPRTYKVMSVDQDEYFTRINVENSAVKEITCFASGNTRGTIKSISELREVLLRYGISLPQATGVEIVNFPTETQNQDLENANSASDSAI